MVRLKDVAYLAGYDISTVSKVLQGGNIHASEEARERIFKAARELGYRPNLAARALRKGRTGAVVLAFPGLSGAVYPELTRGAEAAAQALGVALFAYKFPESNAAEALLDLVNHGRADGIILADDLPCPDFIELASNQNVPVITLNRYEAADATSVILDDETGFSIQASYLRGLGHQNIAFVAVHPESESTIFCCETFLAQCASTGCPIPDENVFYALFDGSDIGPVLAEILKLNPRPTAIATGSLVTALRIIQGLGAAGIKVPEEISVIGYHDSPMAEWSTPQTTSVRMPSFQQGQRAVYRLLSLIQNEKAEQTELISNPIMVVERGSCARAPQTPKDFPKN